MTGPNLFRLISLFVLVICFSIKGECLKERLIGGVLTRPDEFRYIVYVKSVGGGFLGTCTGGILSQDLIITAAHCIIDEKTNEFAHKRITVIAGSNDVKDPNNPGIEIAVEVVMVPWSYNPLKGSDMDIALLKLKQPLDLKGKKLARLSLPTTTIANLKDPYFELAGFGLTQVNTQSDGKLRKSKMELDRSCGNWDRRVLPKTSFCAKMINHKRLEVIGVCSGDSGGPLVQGMTVYGVTSFGHENCNENRAPTVFTNVGDFIAFIKQALNGKMAERFKVADKTGSF